MGLCQCSQPEPAKIPEEFVSYGKWTIEGQDLNIPDKRNQDRLIAEEITIDIYGADTVVQKKLKLFGVCDGHGIEGGEVAEIVATRLPKIIVEFFEVDELRPIQIPKPEDIQMRIPSKSISKKITEKSSTNGAIEDTTMEQSISKESISDRPSPKPKKKFKSYKPKYMRGLNSVSRVLEESVRRVCREVDESPVDSHMSGCTLLLCTIFDGTLYTVNLGDSRAVLARAEGKFLQAVALSTDHSPGRNSLRLKVNQQGGIIRLDTEGHHVLTALTPRETNAFTLGVMAGVGDNHALKYGYSHKPEITCHTLTEKDQFLVLASDGVWNMYSNKNVIELCFEATRLQTAENDLNVCTQKVCEQVKDQWERRSDRRDDISLIIALLKDQEDLIKAETSMSLAGYIVDSLTNKPPEASELNIPLVSAENSFRFLPPTPRTPGDRIDVLVDSWVDSDILFS